jgi:transposase-like protein
MSDPFRYFNSPPKVIRLVVMMYVQYPLSLRNVEDLVGERGIDINHVTVRTTAKDGPKNCSDNAKKCAQTDDRREALIPFYLNLQ